MRRTFILMLALLVVAVTGAVAQTMHKATLKDTTMDASNWTIEPTEATTTGVVADTEVTVIYGGKKKVKNVKAVWKDAPATDLSMVDCAGNARTSMTTANCYMVHTAGYYKLPLVYGNAIKDGADNTEAYNPGGTASDTYAANFVNHADNPITAPWITKSTSGEGVDKGMGITVSSAELLWQDAQGLIAAVGINGDYLTLTVGKNATKQEGNALVAAKDADGTIVWSWHIWVTKQTFDEADLTIVTVSGYDYQLTPVNVGWVGDATSTTGYHTYYQWGRKDAFIPSAGTGDKQHTVYDISNNVVSGFSHVTGNRTIGFNIQHPTWHICTNNNRPCNKSYYNMWDAQQTSTDVAATATVKTVYDPCPPGFCVPTAGLYDYIKGQTRPAWHTGYTYSDVFFPASGFYGAQANDVGHVRWSGNYWSATPYTTRHGRLFLFDDSMWSLSYYERADGCPVRAVTE